MTTAYPLHWPKEWPRTTSRGKSQFKTSLEGAINNVDKSLKMFATDSGKRVENLLVSSNFQLMARNPTDPGVAVYFTWDGLSTCIAVDRYARIEENLQAIHHCIEAERVKLRHGGLNLVRAAFRGYAALPPPRGREWWDVLEIRQDATLEAIERQYKRLAGDHHPDRGGSAEKMAEVNQAIATARKEKE